MPFGCCFEQHSFGSVEFGVVIFETGEEMAVHIESHLNRTVPKQCLHALWAEALFDCPASVEVSEPM